MLPSASSRAERLQELFLAAVDIADPHERALFLHRLCPDDPVLLREVESLIAADSAAGSFLERGARLEARMTLPAARLDTFAGQQTGPTGAEASLPLIPGYEVLGVLGRGGIGVVYQARHLALKRLVAVKMLVAGTHASADQVARLRAEAEAVARLQHPNIVQIHEIGEHGGLSFLALEFVDGGSLERKLSGATQHPRAAAELVLVLAQAMHQAHQAGIIHRDLKPANVLLTADGTPKITDFGLAKQLGAMCGLTQTGAIMGTPSYMAPEQAAGNAREIGPRTDIYALGAILYEMLAGRPPFKADTPMDTIMQVMDEDPVSLVRLRPKLSADLETICFKCLQKDRSQRYATADDLADDLRRFLRGEPIRARPVGRFERLVRWCRREPMVAALTGAVTVVLVGAVVGLSAALHYVDRAREGEEFQRIEAEKQAEVARKSEKEAKDSDAIQRAALDFVENRIFAAVRPEDLDGGLGRDVKLMDALTAALPLLATNFKEQPLVEARLRMSIGKSFFHLGNFVKAQHEFTRARKLFTETLGSEHPETLSSMHSFASSYVAENGVSPEMLALREDTLKLRMNKLGRYHPDTLASMGALAYSYVMVGHNDKALKLYSEAVALCEEKLGADDQQTLGNISGLALTYNALGHYQDARDLYEKVHKIYRTKFGPEHPYTLESGRTLAWCYVYLNRQAEALMLFSRIFELSKVKLGADHPTTLLTENGVIRSLHKLGRTAEAIAMIDEFVGLEHENRRWRLIMEALLIRLRYFAETKNAIECQKTADIWERKLNKKEWLHVRTAVVMRTVTAGVSAQKGNAGAAEEQASRAMRWLQYLDSFGALRAVDMEHNDQDIPRSQPDFKKEDLDILRSRPDFKSLLAKLRRTK